MSGVLVTGGASGIGATTCAHLARSGYHVVVVDRNADGAGAVADAVGGTAFVADVSDPAQAESSVAAAVAAVGDLMGLVTCAGIGNLKPLEDYTDSEVDLIWRVNVTGTFNYLRSAVGHLRAAQGRLGRPTAVVTVASVSGVRPTLGEGPYAAAKAAVIALTQSAALEWAPAVRVNCVSPGFVRTPLNEVLASDPGTRESLEGRTPMQRLGTPEDVAAVVEFLLSPEAGYLTGQNIVLDGGSTLLSAQMDPVLGPLLEMFRPPPPAPPGSPDPG